MPLAAFVLACLGVNLLIVATGPQADYPRFVAQSSIPIAGTDSPLAARLATDLATQWDVFDEFDPVALGEAYQHAVGYQGLAAAMIAAKYAYAVPAVAQRAADNRALDVYYASDTSHVHSSVFGTLLGAITIEVFVMAGVAASQLRSVEEHGGPSSVLYSSRVGRKALRTKVLAVLVSISAAYLLLALTGVGFAAARYDLPGVWQSSVGASFNQIQDIVVGERPFFTWLDLDVGGYLLASLGVGLALTVAVAIGAAAIGLLVPNAYLGFGTLLVGGGILLAGPMLDGASAVGMITALNPVWLWLEQPGWFTDGGITVPVPYFETVGTSASLALAGITAAMAYRGFIRADV